MTAPSRRFERRRHWLRSGVVAVGAGGAGLLWLTRGSTSGEAAEAPGADHAGAASFDAHVTVDPREATQPVNRRLLGANVQWVDRGDEMLEPNTLQFRAGMLDAMVALRPTILRYPGGTLSDTFHWRDGEGGLKDRKAGENYWTRKRTTVEMGTRELLDLCRLVGAEPLITVNVITGTPSEAADWVSATNVTGYVSARDGSPLPKVKYWEVGNEPYLNDDARPELAIEPSEFARRASACAAAMREADPSILIGVPSRSDLIGGVSLTPYKGFSDTVLREFSETLDFVCVHDAYLPFAVDRQYSDSELYWAAMAASEVVAADLVATRAQLKRLRPGREIPLAVTEYGAIFTLTLDRVKTDAYIRSLAGALYLADLLRMLSGQPDLLLGVLHSLSGNWHFGMVSNEGVARPAYFVLQGISQMLKGKLAPLKIETDTFHTGRVGAVPPLQGLPLVSGMAAADDGTLRLLLINKDWSRTSRVSLTVAGQSDGSEVRLETIDGDNVFDTTDVTAKVRRRSSSLRTSGGVATMVLPAHSINFVELVLP